MKILFFLEPVIFRDEPSWFFAHFPWVECFRRAAKKLGGKLILVANAETCRRWADTAQPGPKVVLREVDGFSILKGFGLDKHAYARALYGEGGGGEPLSTALSQIRNAVSPDLVVMTAQNAFASHAFRGLPILSVEQPPLPRLGYPFRTGLDPCGHQTGSILEREASRIRHLVLSPEQRRDAGTLLDRIEERGRDYDVRAREACSALRDIGKEGRIALLATQPTDYVTFEGAYRSIEIQNLLYEWGEALPEGWMGVPTYHVGQRISRDMEAALARSCSRIRLLPHHLSQGTTESLLPIADGLVTISSTSAMTALLFGKRVAVTGRAPFSSWAVDHPSRLAEAVPLEPDEIVSTFAFLTHRFSYSHARLMSRPEDLAEILRQATAPGVIDWFLDVSDWSLDRAEELFPQPGDSGPQSVEDESFGVEHATLGQLRERYHALEKEREKLFAERVLFEEEWAKAVIDRDRIDAERVEVAVLAGVLEEQLASAVAGRDRIEAEYAKVMVLTGVLEGDLASAVADRDRIDAERQKIVVRADILGQELASAVTDRDRINDERKGISSEADALRRELSAAIGDRDRIDEERKSVTIRADILERELASAVADRDRIDDERKGISSEADVLRRELSAAIGDRDRIDEERKSVTIRADILERELVSAIAGRDRINAEWQAAELRGSDLAMELNAVIVDRDRLDSELLRLRQRGLMGWIRSRR